MSHNLQKTVKIVSGLLDALSQHGETEVQDVCNSLRIVCSLSPMESLAILSLLQEEGFIEGVGEEIVNGVTMVNRVYITKEGKKALHQHRMLQGDPSRN